jgi:hypothetical protein
MSFDWELHKVWSGYLNPYYVECVACHGRGNTNSARVLDALVRLIMIAGADSVRGKTHPYFTTEFSPLFDSNDFPMGADMAELTSGLAGRPPGGIMGHDSCDSWTATKKIIQAAGLDPDNWGICPVCSGEGIEPDKLAAYEAWEPEEPPFGDGYQLWETTSEGSPVSPVFATLDELCVWAESNATTFGDHTTTVEEWKKMLLGGLVHHREGNITFI